MSRATPSSKLYSQDIVRLVDDPTEFGIVLRCWHDSEDMAPDDDDDPMMRPLVPGEVGIALLGANNARKILPENELVLMDRNFQEGDYVKRSIDDVQSGVVVDTEVRGRLEHVINATPVDGWKEPHEVVPAMEADVGDYVLYNDWIGQIIELCDENIIEVSNGQLVRLPDFGSRFVVGEKGTDILPHGNSMHHIFGFLLGNRPSSQEDTVIEVTHTVYAIAWLAINQTLTPTEAQKRERPEKFWWGQHIGKLTLIRNHTGYQMRVGDRVELVDNSNAPVTVHGTDSQYSEIIHVSTLVVKETETTVTVLWQDGTKESWRSVNLIPYLNTDEYDSWPGDHVIWRGEDFQRAAVVQSVDAQHRLASLHFPDTQTEEVVSVLELDTHGTSDLDQNGDGLGVRIGDFVFIHPEDSTNGYVPPRVPRIGELEAWVRELPYPDGYLEGWRKEMSDMCTEIAKKRGTDEVFDQTALRLSHHSKDSFNWIGEVVQLLLDGTVVIVHPDTTKKTYPLSRLTKLNDGMDQLLEDGGWDTDHEHEHHHHHHHHHHDGEDEDMEDWEDYEESGSVVEADIWEDLDEDESSIDNLPDDEIGMDIEGDGDVELGPLPPVVSTPPEAGEEDVLIDASEKASDEDPDLPWKRFDILSSAPVDHAYYSTTPSAPSKQFHSRLRKEYRVLSTSLPDNIIVRTYEDRADLLRSLIIGPQNTPYEDAPFVIDWMLDSNFPNSPPQAHFLSWTNGNGRVNPNLYEEGKVCLSILGTWAGDQNETWSAGRSSLLQAFVSIQGLVLVKEPWFCEPAYEKLRGTEEGIVNSRLYNEKAYVLSRGFVRRALEVPLGDLKEEIKHIYYTEKRLDKVVSDARKLIEKSQDPNTAAAVSSIDGEDLAVPRLTAGGILSLGRTLTRLQTLLDSVPLD